MSIFGSTWDEPESPRRGMDDIAKVRALRVALLDILNARTDEDTLSAIQRATTLLDNIRASSKPHAR